MLPQPLRLTRTTRLWPPVGCCPVLALCLLLTTVDPVTAGSPVRTDCYGDPLPTGALARLGTVRFRHAGLFLVAYAPDGKTLLSAGGGTFRRWEAVTGKELQRWPITSGNVDCAALSTDSKTLAVAREEQIALYDTATGKELRRLKAAEKWMVHSLAFSPDGELLAAKPPYDALVTLWEVRTGKKRRELKPQAYDEADFGQGLVLRGQNLAFSPDGNHLACASEDGIVRLWQVATGREVRQHSAATHTPLSVAFSPDGKVLAWTGQRHIRLAEVATGKELPPLPAGEDTPGQLAFSPDSRVLASVHSRDEVRLWDVAQGKLLRRLEGDLYAVHEVAFSPDGKTLAAGLSCRIGRWDVVTGKERPAPGGSVGPVYGLALSPAGRTVAVAYYGATVRLWDTATGRQRQELAEDAFDSFAFAPDGKTLATLAWARDRNVLRFADVATGKEVRRFQVPLDWSGSLAYSADGTTVVLGNRAGGQVLDAATGRKVHEFQTRLPGNTSSWLAFAADGTTMVLKDGPRVLPWDMATGRQYPPCRVADEEIREAALSPDGKTLALWVFRWELKGRRRVGVSKGSGMLVLYEVATGRERCRFGGQDDLASDPDFSGLAFSPDARILAVLSANRIHFWDIAEGKEVGQLQTRQDAVRCLAFAADGRTLASAGLDTTVLLWDLPPLGRPATQAPPRVLTPAELEGLWFDLAGEDGARAYRAVGTLSAAPAAVGFLQERLEREAVDEAKRRRRIPQLLADLDSDEFAVRRSAAAELERLSELAEPLLRRALAGRPSVEFRRRAEQLLEKREGAAPALATVRVLRAAEVLERVATPEARQALQALAKGAPETRVTQEAKASLQRLATRPLAERGAVPAITPSCGRDLRKLEETEVAEFLGNVTRLVPGRTYRPDFDFRPWYIWEYRREPEQPQYLLFEVNDSLGHPRNPKVRITLFDNAGKLLSETSFGTGWRRYLCDAKPEATHGSEYPLLVLRMVPGSGPALQYYAQFGSGFGLVRLEGSDGSAARNDYSFRHFMSGPALPVQTASEWESDLLSRDRWRVLRGLVWIGGVHLRLDPGDKPDSQGETPADVLLVRAVRTREKVSARLRELAGSEDRWLREAARLASNPAEVR